jgi:Fe-S-cluster containining protein
MDEKQLEAIYAQVPELECKRLCSHICKTGPIRIGRLELERIVNRLGYEPHGDLTTGVCPLLKDGLCTIHDIRPLICRLWGTTRKMKCKFGCKPEKWLSSAKVKRLLDEVYRDGISYDLWGETEYHNAKKGIEAMIEREHLKKMREEYYSAYFEALGAANANHGAMQAIDRLLAEMDKETSEEPASEE